MRVAAGEEVAEATGDVIGEDCEEDSGEYPRAIDPPGVLSASLKGWSWCNRSPHSTPHMPRHAQKMETPA